jgi:uroporphyrin-III C-methyltransferase
MPDDFVPGEVWLVGAGPGDPDLLTRKAVRLLENASIVFYDALVGRGVIELIPPNIARVPVGKRAGRHSQSQDAINALLVRAALAGGRVVRLKGGDPSIFGRSAEELDALAAHGISAQICPGITTASAAVASAGLSLTLRGKARHLRFMTAQDCDSDVEPDWASLADAATTLAIYMGRRSAARISRNLIAHGLSPDTPVLVASDVSVPHERRITTRLDLLALAVNGVSASGPVLIMIGEAMRARLTDQAACGVSAKAL